MPRRLKRQNAGGRSEDDPIAGLERAQADYDAADAGFRARQREILQEVFRSVTGLIGDDETRCTFMDDEAIAQYVGHKADRGDVWFYALAYVYRATSRAKRQRASKHAAALRLLYSENVETDEIAATIKKRGGIQKLTNEAAKPSRKGAKKCTTRGDADSEEENGEAIDDADVRGTDEDDAEPEAENGEENDDAELGDAEEDADADREVRFSISDELTAKIRTCRGKRIKIIARVPRKMNEEIKVLKVIKLNTDQR